MTESDRKLGHRWFDLVWNQKKRDAIDQLLAPDVVFHDSGIDTNGRDNFYAFYDRLNAMFSDFHIEVNDAFAEHDLLCVRWTCTATHSGLAFGIPATGNPILVTGISIGKIANGQFVEIWQNWDMLAMTEQIKHTDAAQLSPTYVKPEHATLESARSKPNPKPQPASASA
jgi:steroid delta-isomerase-like uncharacterized protein